MNYIKSNVLTKKKVKCEMNRQMGCHNFHWNYMTSKHKEKRHEEHVEFGNHDDDVLWS